MPYLSADDSPPLLTSSVDTTQADLTTGTPMHPGVRTAYLITNRDNLTRLSQAAARSDKFIPYILCLDHDSVDDFASLQKSNAFLSFDASPNSWCAVQAKSEGLPSIIGLKGSIRNDGSQEERTATLIADDKTSVAAALKPGFMDVYTQDGVEPSRVYDGELITVDGTTGRIYAGECKTNSAILPVLFKYVAEVVVDSLNQHGNEFGWHLLDQSDLYQERKARLKDLLQDRRVSQILAHLSNLPDDYRPAIVGTVHTVPGVVQARLAGCSIIWDKNEDRLMVTPKAGNYGIGLLRTERVFTRRPELDDLRVITLGRPVFSSAEINASLTRFTAFVEAEYKNLMLVNCGGLVVTRTLCMPNNKLFPPDFDIERFAREYGRDPAIVRGALETSIHESETFHGARGTRLHMLDENLAKAEIRAYLAAITAVRKRDGKQRFVLLMSMVTLPTEVDRFSGWLDEIAQSMRAEGEQVPFVKLAIMVETAGAYLRLERFCSISNTSCELVGFFFGGNDLTAAVLNMNRADSVKKLIPAYQESGLFEHDPFIRLNELVIETIAEGARRIRRVLGDRAFIGFGGEQAADY